GAGRGKELALSAAPRCVRPDPDFRLAREPAPLTPGSGVGLCFPPHRPGEAGPRLGARQGQHSARPDAVVINHVYQPLCAADSRWTNGLADLSGTVPTFRETPMRDLNKEELGFVYGAGGRGKSGAG